jgi:hypothetical protein
VLAADPFAGGAALPAKHCLACHNEDDPNGNLDFGALQHDAQDRDNCARWDRMHDRVKAGEMPPAEEPRPEAKALASFMDGPAHALTESERAIYARNGRATLRRLNRYEYENALGTKWRSHRDGE